MALIVPSGGLVSQVNGTVDGKVYYRGRWGNTVRAWVNPANTITPQRTAIRALFASLMSLFNSLTPDMQDDWDDFARSQVKFNRLAQPYIPTGLQVFLERNINLGILSLGPLLLPPFDDLISSLSVLTATNFSAFHIEFSGNIYDGSTIVPANHCLVLYTTDNTPPGRKFQSNRYRITELKFAGSFIDTNLWFPWTVVWLPSSPTSGQKIFVKAILINTITGQASKPAFCSQILT